MSRNWARTFRSRFKRFAMMSALLETAPAKINEGRNAVTKKKNSLVPTRKTGSSTVAGALTFFVVWGLHEFAHIELPPEGASSLTLLLMALTSYFVPNAE